MADPSSRMLRLLSLLQTHRHWPGGELADRLEVSPRTLRRDIDRLRDLGYPVHATRGTDGGYRLEAGADIPPLLLDDEEAVAIAVGLRTAASGAVAGIDETSVRALAKLEQVLPWRLRHRVHALQTATVPMPPVAGAATVDPGTLTVIAQTCRDHEQLRFDYVGADGGETRRVVEPHALVPAWRRWYLVAWDVERGGWRTFRVDRLERPRAGGTRFSPRPLPADDAAAYVRRSFAAIPARWSATVTLHGPHAALAAVIPGWVGDLEAVDDATCRLRVGGDSLEWLAVSLGLTGVEFDVDGPPELVAQLATLGDRFKGAAARAGARVRSPA